MKRKYWSLAHKLKERLQMPAAALAEHRRDRGGAPNDDPGSERVLDELIEWLCRAQDSSSSKDGGVAHHYSLIDGWASSYPETTGYIIPTLLAYGRWAGRKDLFDRTRRMLDWLVRIQLPSGGFPGGQNGFPPGVGGALQNRGDFFCPA